MMPLVLDPRFCGPPDCGNGGYVAGRLAAHVRGACEVTLLAPAPLGRPLWVVDGDGGVELREGDRLLARARATRLAISPPPAPDPAAARARAGSCRAFATHPFPHCFVCGPDRAEGDGLRIFPGWLHETELAAAPWRPDASLADASGAVRPEFVWAALDCTSAFPLLEPPEHQRLEPLVLGRIAAEQLAPLRAGEPCVVAAWTLALEGKRGRAGVALWSSLGDPVAVAQATWVSLA